MSTFSVPILSREVAASGQIGLHATVPMLVDVRDPFTSAHSPPQVGIEQTVMIINGDTLSELKAVANACKEFADTLVSRGNPTGDANHVRDVHRAYVRYLVLYPDRDGHHYVR
ncbi:hypothetical protein C8J57DRAFT_1471337, partial [Mycena rebaudengoi]